MSSIQKPLRLWASPASEWAMIQVWAFRNSSIHNFILKVIHQIQSQIAEFSFHRRVGVHHNCGDPLR